MAAAEQGTDLVHVVALLGAAVVAVPLFKRAGLGSVLGYLAAGLVIGPFGLKLFTSPQAILHVAELGVVMFLFVIGLEMQPSRLWSLRHEIFGLGVAQVAACGALLTGVGILAGFAPLVAFLAAMGFVLSSTAIVAQILEERGDTATPVGQRVVSILLLQDLAIVPLLALVAFLAPGAPEATASARWLAIGVALAAIAALWAAGRWLLNPLFRILADARAREVMTAAALLVVLGAALLMQLSGLSMALGAFLAGVLLSESTFRHQLEADIEPFRGILLGLFFLGVGMSLDLAVLAQHWPLILAGVPAYMVVKAAGIYLVARLFRASHRDGIYLATLLAQGGEFAFVLYAAAASVGLFDATTNAVLTATVIISMALTPLGVFALRWLLPEDRQSMDGIDAAEDLHGSALIIGFGRFGQVASQSLLARGFDISLIDTDTEMIRAAAPFGFKVYYGDGCRLDVLRAAGAGEARAILVCVDKRDAADRIVALVKAEFPLAKLLVRSFDREHALKLVATGVDMQIRETFESALKFGELALRALGVPEDEAAETAEDIRRRDAERFALETTGGLLAGRDLLHGNAPEPVPFTQPRRTRPAAAEPADGVEKSG
ncbi:MAG: monovalent cation:proton antiporter-2 (CPA2) family protein [Xanthobacteraceae bacterium]|nr:monovalent cation:proton antiporter-2 (CPA2) family protein [Xanthobacteraceae bacterium]